MAESFFSILRRELLDEQPSATRRQLALAVFEWIEAWYNPHHRHTSIGSLSPIAYEAARGAADARGGGVSRPARGTGLSDALRGPPPRRVV